MSGTPNWAFTLPSLNSTSEWTMDSRCRTTSTFSMGTSNSHIASIVSMPLFISVAESTVILGPMFHVGWLSACSAVTPANWLAS